MNQRFLFVGSLLLALVTSAGGYLLVTAFCADSAPAEMACHRTTQASNDTHDAHSANRHETRETAAAETTVTGEQPLETCSHCVSHPNLPQSGPVLRHAQTPQSSTQFEAPDPSTRLSYVVSTPRFIDAREHAPPGRSSPLHVRINVFRI